jgi:hypothetical protein
MVVGLEPVERGCAADSGDLSHYAAWACVPTFGISQMFSALLPVVPIG